MKEYEDLNLESLIDVTHEFVDYKIRTLVAILMNLRADYCKMLAISQSEQDILSALNKQSDVGTESNKLAVDVVVLLSLIARLEVIILDLEAITGLKKCP